MIADYFEVVFPAVVRTARRQGAADPEDLAAEAFAKSLRAEARGRTIEPSYIFRAAHNLVVDSVRGAGGVAAVSLDALPPHQVPGLIDDNMIETMAAASAAERILAGLTPLQAQVLRLRSEGYHIKEVAALIGRSEDSIKKLVARGRIGALMDAQGVSRSKPWLRTQAP